jgi:YVTN family beta-propeller protein
MEGDRGESGEGAGRVHMRDNSHGGGRRAGVRLTFWWAIAAAVNMGLAARAQNAVTAVPVGFGGGVLVVNPVTDKIYVSGDTAMTVIDGATNASSAITGATAVAVDSDTDKLYGFGGIHSGVPDTPYVTVTDGVTNATTTLAGIAGPIAVNAVTNKVYVANVHGNVTVIDGATNAETAVALGALPGAIAANPVTNKVYVVNQTGNSLTVIDGATNATTVIPAGSGGPIAVNAATNKIYESNTGGNSVTVIDGVTNAATTVALESYPGAIAVNPVTNLVYVDVEGTGSVAVIDGATNAVTYVPVGDEPGVLAVNTVTNTVYVAVFHSKNVAVIDGLTNAVSTITVGTHPECVAVNEATNKVYATDDSYNVAVIDANAVPTAPVFSSEPGSQTVAEGASAVFAAPVISTPNPAFQWSLNGTALADGPGISGSQSATLLLSGASVIAGAYACTATNGAGATSSSAAVLTVMSTPTPGRLVNLSARAPVGTGPNVLITGFVIGGSAPLPVLLRASGPALIPLGVPGALADPQLQLYGGASVIDSNAGWAGNSRIASTASSLGAFAWNNPASKDSALLENLNPGTYTAVTSGTSGDSGVALAEVYDATPAGTWTTSLPHLVNLSARASVGTGGNVLIAGFVIAGSTAKTVLIRASGPALDPLGVVGTLFDPQLQLYSNGSAVAGNTGWNGDAPTAAAAARVGAFPWTDPSSDDSALLMTLSPGAYTAVVSGANGDAGVALVEVYDVP